MRVLEVRNAFGLENLTLAERPDPAPGPGQVLVRMQAVSLNYRDLVTIAGLYGPGGRLPLIPFSDGAGVIEAIGPGVARFKPGDRVTSLFFSETWLAGRPTVERLSGALGGARDGCGAELLAISEHGVSAYPDHLSAEEASTLPCAALTAWRALVADAQVKAGDVVLLQGTGGVSIFGLQFAKALGCETVVTSSSDEKLAQAKALGADHLINYRTTPDWGKQTKRLTNGRGADLVIEVGGSNTMPESLKAIRFGGHIAVVGFVAGAGALPDTRMLVATSARLQGLSVGSREQYEDMARAIALHKIKPVIGQRFPWTQAREALHAMQAGAHVGKIVLTF